MGRKTWESIPEKYRPLRGRINLVLTKNSNQKYPSEVLVSNDFDKALELIKKDSDRGIVESIYVIGGQQIFNIAISFVSCQKLYVTQIDHSFDCDTFFPKIPNIFMKKTVVSTEIEGSLKFSFNIYERMTKHDKEFSGSK